MNHGIMFFAELPVCSVSGLAATSIIPESPARSCNVFEISINLLVVYRESVNLIGYITRRLSADSHQL